MKWWRRFRSDREPEDDPEHRELVEVKIHYYRRSKARAEKALNRLQVHIEREAKRVELLMREGQR